MILRFTSWIAFVTLDALGHASVQLKVVRHRKTPFFSARMSSREVDGAFQIRRRITAESTVPVTAVP